MKNNEILYDREEIEFKLPTDDERLTILENNLWDRFLSMCEAEYNILKNYSDYTITMVSNDPDILDNRGIIINPPLTTTTVSYTVTVTKGSDTKSITLSSIVEGSLKTPARDFTNLPG